MLLFTDKDVGGVSSLEVKLEKKYGLFTAIAMIVGIVIGSGIFFKTQSILISTNGNLYMGTLAWVLGGLVMLSCAYVFSNMACKYQKVNGLLDYSEAIVGKKYAYYVGWFMATVYYPSFAGVVAWAAGKFTVEFIKAVNPEFTLAVSIENGGALIGPECMTISAFYLILFFVINVMSPKIAGKFQVSTTIIKLIPLLLMSVFGIIYGFRNGVTMENLKYSFADNNFTQGSNHLLGAVVSAAFAYEGWIVVTTINAELKNAKRNLPIALIAGSLLVMLVYIFYYIGVCSGVSISDIMTSGTMVSFANVFGGVFGTIIYVFIIISCLGTLNGVSFAASRGMYSLAVRNEGPYPCIFGEIDNFTNMPSNSTYMGLLFSVIWMVYFYGANLSTGWFGYFNFDNSELPVITIYVFYIPIFVLFMIKEKEFGFFKRIITPLMAICGCLFMIFATVFSHGIEPYKKAQEYGKLDIPVLFYLIVFLIIMLIGAIFRKPKKDRYL